MTHCRANLSLTSFYRHAGDPTIRLLLEVFASVNPEVIYCTLIYILKSTFLLFENVLESNNFSTYDVSRKAKNILRKDFSTLLPVYSIGYHKLRI